MSWVTLTYCDILIFWNCEATLIDAMRKKCVIKQRHFSDDLVAEALSQSWS